MHNKRNKKHIATYYERETYHPPTTNIQSHKNNNSVIWENACLSSSIFISSSRYSTLYKASINPSIG